MDKLDQATEQLFAEALELGTDQRRAFLEDACRGEPALRFRVQRLLEEHDRLRGFFSESPMAAGPKAPGHSLPEGARIGRYTVVAQIGSGGMGEVYRARDTSLRRDVALKVLRPGLAGDAAHVSRFQREARALAALNHPGICTIYEIGEHAGLVFIAMEFLEGSNLRQRLGQKPMEPDAAVAIATQIADALDAAHTAGIVHRDIKPANLFITSREQVRILDFGIARVAAGDSDTSTAVDPLTDPGDAMGTVAYMSPEQVRGKTVDPRSDLFSFGVVLYEMLTGALPFHGESQGLAFEAILNRDPAPPRQLNPALPALAEEIVLKMLEKDRDLRYQHASEIRADLRRLKRNTETGRHPVELPATRRTLRLPLWIWPPAALAALVLAWLLRPTLPPPTVIATTQLTHDYDSKGIGAYGAYPPFTDGSRLYYIAGVNSQNTLMQVSTSGGQGVPVPIPPGFDNSADLSVARSELLFLRLPQKNGEDSLWVQPLPGGEARRVGDLYAGDAAWTPDGKSIYLNTGNAVAVANSDGSHLRKLFSPGGYPFGFRFSPDGRVLRFSTLSDGTHTTMWEMRTDGSGLHPFLADWHDAENPCCGEWTPDGKYFLFQARRDGVFGLWAIREAPAFWHKISPRPVQLSQDLLRAMAPTVSPDGKKVFFVGSAARAELVRYDPKTGNSIPVLPNLSVESASFSPDGNNLAYISYPEGILWVCGADGSDPHQLTLPPMEAGLERWSPDGQSIAFATLTPGHTGQLYVASPRTGDLRQVSPGDADAVDPTWSPDGKSIAYAVDREAENAGKDTLRILDIATGKSTPVPHSAGLWSPRWSPDGRWLLAMTAGSASLMLYNFSTQRWTQLARASVAYPSWSHDSQCVYFNDTTLHMPEYRVCLSDREVRHVANLLPDGNPVVGSFGAWSGLGPHDSLLAVRDISTEELYSLDVHFP